MRNTLAPVQWARDSEEVDIYSLAPISSGLGLKSLAHAPVDGRTTRDTSRLFAEVIAGLWEARMVKPLYFSYAKCLTPCQV